MYKSLFLLLFIIIFYYYRDIKRIRKKFNASSVKFDSQINYFKKIILTNSSFLYNIVIIIINYKTDTK